MTHPQPRQPRPLRKLISWMAVIPVVSVVLAVLGNLALIFAAVLAFCAVGAIRYQLGERERGFVWGTLALVSAMAVAGSSPFLAYSYVALRGERVDAVVVEELPGREVRIADPVTNEDLGTRGGRGTDRRTSPRGPVGPYYYKVGDTVPVLVASRFGLEALPLNNVDLSVNFAKAWLGGWLLGLGLTVVSTVQQGRRSQPVG